MQRRCVGRLCSAYCCHAATFTLRQSYDRVWQVRYELASGRLVHALQDLVALELETEPSHEDLDGRRG